MIRLPNLSSRDRRALFLGLIGLGVILVIRFLLMPWASSWSSAREAIASDADRLTQTEIQLRRVLRDRGEMEKNLGPGVRKPLEAPEAAALKLGQAARTFAASSGIQEPSCQPQPAKKMPGDGRIQIVSLRLSGKCQLPQLARFIGDLAKADSLVVLDQVALTGNDKQPGNLQVSMTLLTLAGEGNKP